MINFKNPIRHLPSGYVRAIEKYSPIIKSHSYSKMTYRFELSEGWQTSSGETTLTTTKLKDIKTFMDDVININQLTIYDLPGLTGDQL